MTDAEIKGCAFMDAEQKRVIRNLSLHGEVDFLMAARILLQSCGVDYAKQQDDAAANRAQRRHERAAVFFVYELSRIAGATEILPDIQRLFDCL